MGFRERQLHNVALANKEVASMTQSFDEVEKEQQYHDGKAHTHDLQDFL